MSNTVTSTIISMLSFNICGTNHLYNATDQYFAILKSPANVSAIVRCIVTSHTQCGTPIALANTWPHVSLSLPLTGRYGSERETGGSRQKLSMYNEYVCDVLTKSRTMLLE